MSSATVPVKAARGLRATRISSTAAPLVLLPIALGLWAGSLPFVRQREMSDLGLISVLPPATLVGLACLTVSFALCLHRPGRGGPLALLHVLALIVMLYAITPLIDEVPRYTVTWRHLGVAEHVARLGTVDPGIDAYFNWPGFFVFSAFLAGAAGVDSRSLVDWSPVFYSVLYLGPLFLIARTATSDRRLVWMTLWFFYLVNWIGQDYFSPQGQMFFVFLVIVAVLLRWFPGRGDAFLPRLLARAGRPPVRWLRRRGSAKARAAEPERREELPPLARAGLVAIVILLVAAIVPSHQLTPFMTLLGVTALVIFGRCSARGLPLVILVVAVTWMSFMAAAYLEGHIGQLVGGVGKLEESAQANVGGRLTGSPEHVLVVYTRLLLAAFVWALALLGALRVLRRGTPSLPMALLAAAPFPLLPIQPYGGEMLMRVYLFSLPFMAFSAATLFYPRPEAGRSRLATAAVALTSAALIVPFLLARYGNERMDFYTANEVRAVERLYELAPPGSLLLGGSGNLPWKFQDYEQHEYELVSKRSEWNPIVTGWPVPEIVFGRVHAYMADWDKGAYLIFTRSQKAEVDLMGVAQPGFLDRFEELVAASPGFRRVYSNPDAAIYVLRREKGMTP